MTKLHLPPDFLLSTSELYCHVWKLRRMHVQNFKHLIKNKTPAKDTMRQNTVAKIKHKLNNTTR